MSALRWASKTSLEWLLGAYFMAFIALANYAAFWAIVTIAEVVRRA